MKPYVDSNGKAKSQLFWVDKLAKKYRKYFKKSARVVVAVGIQDASGSAWKNGDLEYSPSDDFYNELNKQLGDDWAELRNNILKNYGIKNN
jgi:hypothetical protein